MAAEKDTQSRKWLLTINNPIEHGFPHSEINNILTKMKSIVYYCMADEVGENGTYHTHIFIQGRGGIRFSSLKKKFPAANLKMCNGSAQENVDYVSKSGKWEKDKKHETCVEGTFEEYGELPIERKGRKADIDDIYDLTAEQLAQAEGFKDKKISNILKAIENSKNVTLDNFIYSLGIANIGKKSAKQLADKFKSLEKLQSASVEDILALDDFGEIMAQSVYGYFASPSAKRLIENLLKKGVKIEFKEQKEGVLTGFNICLTGSISIPRSKAKQLIAENGGSVSDSVSKNVNIVVYGEDAGSKLEKAKKLGIELWTEQQFFEKIDYKG